MRLMENFNENYFLMASVTGMSIIILVCVLLCFNIKHISAVILITPLIISTFNNLRRKSVSKYLRVYCKCLVIYLLFQPVSANDDLKINFEQSSISLPTSLYGAFHIDNDGFIWIGTISFGAYRYDAHEMKSFIVSTDGMMVSSIAEDLDGTIWLASFNNGISSYDKQTGNLTTYKHNPDDVNSLSSNNISFSPQKIKVGLSNTLWVGTDDAGLCEYDKLSNTWTHYTHNPDDMNSLSDNAVMAITEGKDGLLWIGTQSGGLNCFDSKTGIWTHYKNNPDDPSSLNDNWVNSIHEDKEGVLWVGTKNGGLNRFEKGTATFKHYIYDRNDPHSIGSNDVWSIYEDHSGRIWTTHMASPSAGLDCLDKNKETFTRFSHDPNNPNSVSSNSITRVYEDPLTNVMWVVNYNGRIDRQMKTMVNFRHWNDDPKNPNDLHDNAILPIIEDRTGIIWVGTMAGGLNSIDRETGIIRHFLPDPDDPLSIPRLRVTALAEDHSGVLWAGFWDGILASYDAVTGQCIKIYRHNSTDPMSITESERVKYILPDKEDHNILWIATIKGGFERFDKREEVFTHFKHNRYNSNSLSNNSIVTLYDDGNGVLWISTYGGGLDKFEKKTETFTNYRHNQDDSNSFRSNTLYEVLETSEGKLWVSSKQGISQFDPKSEMVVNYEADVEGIPFGPVGSLLEDNNGDLWLATVGRGLIRFNPDTKAIKRFTKSDGLQGDTFYWTSRLKAKNGEIWFGGVNGITSFDPSTIVENPHIPSIILTSFTQGGNSVISGVSPERLKEVTLDWNRNYFEFKFSALNFEIPEKNRYAYMLEGWDKEWYYSDSNPFGRYSGLSSGKYTLRLKGSNNHGVWNNDGISINVIVKPPFWETHGFYSLIIILGLLIVLSIIFYISKLRSEIGGRILAENEVRANAERFKRWKNSNFIGIIQSSASGGISDVNDTLLTMLGYSRQDFLDGKLDWTEMTPPEFLPLDQKAMEEAAVKGFWTPFEKEYFHKDGHRVPIIIGGSIFKEDPDEYIVFVIDISERKKGEKDLQRSTSLLSSVIESPDNIIIFVLDRDYSYLSFNKAHEKEMKKVYDADIEIGQRILSYIPMEDDRHKAEESYKRVLKGERFIRVEDYGQSGNRFWYELIFNPIYNNSRQVTGFTVFVSDITERKLAEEAVRTSEENLRTILNSIGDAVIATDIKGEVIQINPIGEKLTGWKFEDAIGRPLTDIFKIVKARTYEPLENPVDKVLASGEIIGLANHTMLISKDGSEYQIADSGAPIKDTDGEITGVVLVFRDVTKEYLMQTELQRMQKLESIGILAGGIAHDFNNIMMGVFGNISMAKNDLSKDHSGFSSLAEAEQSIKRATRLTKQLLTFAKGGTPVKEDVSIAQLVEEIIRFDLSGSKVMPVFEEAENLWIAEVDKGQIQQVFSNLTINSNQAMPDGGHLYITLENVHTTEGSIPNLKQGKFIKITVRDEGSGIAQKHLDRIFDPYFSTKQTGSGLGLATCYSIIGKHNGHISVDSELGKGTKFTVYLPAAVSPRLETKQPSTESSPLGQTERILVMDDDEVIRKVVTKMLESNGYMVETVPDGKQAIEMYKQSFNSKQPIEVVVMDLTIPGGIGGKEAIKDILEIDPKAVVIVSSGYSNDPVMANHAEYGFKGIISKPYTRKELLEVLNKVRKK